VPQVVVTARAAAGLEKCRRFLASRSPEAARRAAEAIRKSIGALRHYPEIGRPIDEESALRELIIGFGASGYVALYTFDRDSDEVLILAFRHQKEAGY
jgi:plasmid stabilization system protein ParE